MALVFKKGEFGTAGDHRAGIIMCGRKRWRLIWIAEREGELYVL